MTLLLSLLSLLLLLLLYREATVPAVSIALRRRGRDRYRCAPLDIPSLVLAPNQLFELLLPCTATTTTSTTATATDQDDSELDNTATLTEAAVAAAAPPWVLVRAQFSTNNYAEGESQLPRKGTPPRTITHKGGALHLTVLGTRGLRRGVRVNMPFVSISVCSADTSTSSSSGDSGSGDAAGSSVEVRAVSNGSSAAGSSSEELWDAELSRAVLPVAAGPGEACHTLLCVRLCDGLSEGEGPARLIGSVLVPVGDSVLLLQVSDSLC
jgi:hypothetical protein